MDLRTKDKRNDGRRAEQGSEGQKSARILTRRIAALGAAVMLGAALVGCGEAETSADVAYDVNDYVELGDYMEIPVQLTQDYTVTQEMIDETVDTLIQNAQPCVADDTQTVVAADSIVNVDYVGKKDGEAFDGGSASDVNIDLATNSDVASGSSYIEGFSSGLVGAKVGDTVDCPVTFPENYSSQELAGQPVVFTFTVNYIGKPMTRDVLTDDYVSDNFQAASVDEFLQMVDTYVRQTAQYSRQSEIRNAVMDAVVENATVDKVPQEVLDLRIQEYIDQYEATYCSDGTSLEDYLSTNYNTTVEDFTEEVRTGVRENLVMELVFEAIAEKEGISFDQDGFDDFCESLMSGNQVETREELYTLYAPTEEAGEKYLQKVYVCNRACDLCVENAVVSEYAGE